MNIEFYYKEWYNLYIDDNKKEIILNLYRKKLSTKGCFSLIISDNINQYLKKTLKDKNKTIDNLTNNDMHKIIVNLNSSIKISDKQLSIIKEHFPDILSINNYLKKYSQNYVKEKLIDKTYKNLTLIDYNLLINENPDINFKNCLNKIPKSKDYVLEYSKNYEYGYQINEKFEDSKMYYLKFYDILVIDYDDKNLENLHKTLDKYEFAYKIYETKNGYHVYIVSHKIPYNDELSREISLSLNSDKRYIIYSKYNGYNIRLSKKDYEDKFFYKFVEDYGKGKPNEELISLIDILNSKIPNK